MLEALDLQPNSSQAFLCIGSGTGYLCAIAAEIMGPKSLNFGKCSTLQEQKLVTLYYGNISTLAYIVLSLMYLVFPHDTMEGIEIHRDVIAHCQNALKAWSAKKSQGADTKTSTRSHPQIVHGNGLCISSQNGEAVVGFDRIYIGAATERDDLARMSKLLSPGGILVAPGTLG